jgi:hypothetical protein
MMALAQLAELLGFISGIAFAIPAFRLLLLQRRLSRLKEISQDGQSKDGRQLATELREQYKEGIFGFSWFDAGCVAVGVGLLLTSTTIKLL